MAITPLDGLIAGMQYPRSADGTANGVGVLLGVEISATTASTITVGGAIWSQG